MSRSGGSYKVITVSLASILLLASLIPASADIGSGPSTFQAPLDQPQTGEENNTTTPDPMLKIGSLVRIDTNWGSMVLGMYDDGAPITVSNFLNLTRSKFYDGIMFHRIIDGFVIQTGDPNTKNNNPYDDGMGGSPETIPLEVSSNLTHIDGAVGMARSSEPDSASSQFYVCDGPQHGLDGNYAVFAVVVEGMDTVKKISAAPTWGYKRPALKDHPIDDIIMVSVTLEINWSEPDDQENPNPYYIGGGGNVGLEILFWLGLVAMGVVLVALVIRRYLRRRTTRQGGEEGIDDVIEAEVVEEDWRGYDGSEEGGGQGGGEGENWQ